VVSHHLDTASPSAVRYATGIRSGATAANLVHLQPHPTGCIEWHRVWLGHSSISCLLSIHVLMSEVILYMCGIWLDGGEGANVIMSIV